MKGKYIAVILTFIVLFLVACTTKTGTSGDRIRTGYQPEPIATPECCQTNGFMPAQEGVCASRGYSEVDVSNCVGIPTPVPTQECCDTSSTGGYVSAEEGGCVVYGFEEVDTSNCA